MRTVASKSRPFKASRTSTTPGVVEDGTVHTMDELDTTLPAVVCPPNWHRGEALGITTNPEPEIVAELTIRAGPESGVINATAGDV